MVVATAENVGMRRAENKGAQEGPVLQGGEDAQSDIVSVAAESVQ